MFNIIPVRFIHVAGCSNSLFFFFFFFFCAMTLYEDITISLVYFPFGDHLSCFQFEPLWMAVHILVYVIGYVYIHLCLCIHFYKKFWGRSVRFTSIHSHQKYIRTPIASYPHELFLSFSHIDRCVIMSHWDFIWIYL